MKRCLRLHGLTVESGRCGDDHVIALRGELEMANVAAIESELDMIEASACRQIVFDLRGLDFLDSSGIHALMKAHARAADTGRGISLVVDNGAPVHRVLDVCGALEILPRLAEAA